MAKKKLMGKKNLKHLILIFNSRMSDEKKHCFFRSCFCCVMGEKNTVKVKTTNKHPHIQSTQKDLLYLGKFYVSVEFVVVKTTFEIIASK